LDRIPWKFNYIRTLDCGDHGWVEHINHQSATSEKCIEHYYKRAGVILCLAYILKLTDLHAENIIAQGDTPHVIDMEAMFHPFFLREKKTFTVLDTGLLPPESLDHVDIFGLTAIGGEPSQILHCRWRDIGKNEVQPEFVAGKFEVLGNMPILDGQRASAHRYVDCICEGFSLAYEELGNNTLKIKNIIINALCDDAFEVRVIPRSTMQYSIILRNLDIYHYRDIKSSISHIEEALQEGLYYSELDDLSIRRAEIEALERLDIPCFRLRIQKGDIIEHATLVKCIGNQVDAILAGTILNLSEADKGMQRQLIRESFFAPVIERPKI
jgi:lantibiotic modifying enzyme